MLLGGPAGARAGPAVGAPCADPFAAVAHGAAGVVIAPQPVGLPRACSVETGVVSTGPSIAVTSRGTVFVAKSQGGVLRSRDGGRTFEEIDPGEDAAGSTHRNGLHGDVWVDRKTDRVFYVTFGRVKQCGDSGLSAGAAPIGSGEFLSFSDDQGDTWEHSFVGCDMYDWPKVFTGRPVHSKPKGYPEVVYVAASTPLPLGPLKKVYKSLDGGRSWQPTGKVASDSFEAGQGVTAPDGSIYFDEVYTRGADAQLVGSPYPYDASQQGQMRIVVSHDEGDTWKHVVIEGAHAALTTYGAQRVAVDDAGRVYAVWADGLDNKPRMSVSRDRGETWSSPVRIDGPEAVDTHYLVQVAAREAGEVAVSSMATNADRPYPSGAYVPDDRAYTGYISRSRDADATTPTFVTAPVNHADKPLTSELQLTDPGGETLGVALGPDGTAWGAFVRTRAPDVPGPAVAYPEPPHELVIGRLLPQRAADPALKRRCLRSGRLRVRVRTTERGSIVAVVWRVHGQTLWTSGRRRTLSRIRVRTYAGRRLVARVRLGDGRTVRLAGKVPSCGARTRPNS